MARGRGGRKQRRSRSDVHLREAKAALESGNDVSYWYHITRVAKRRPSSMHHVMRGVGGYVRRDLHDMMCGRVLDLERAA